MRKTYCAICGDVITDKNKPANFGEGVNPMYALVGKLKKGGFVNVQVLGSDYVKYDIDYCKYCILDAIYKLDDRPTEGE